MTADRSALIDELADLAARAASNAADLLLDGLDRARTIDRKSTSTDLVTEMDRSAELLIVERILAERPDDAILAEEGSTGDGSSGVRWVIDPLDGTTNYVYGHPGWAVSVGVEVEGIPAAGVVVDPVHDEVYRATDGGGAFCNGEPIRVSDCNDLSQALVATGFGYEPARRRRQAEALVEILPAVRDIRRVGAASVDLCAVARGRVDVYFEAGLAPWDLSAGSVIAAEAGARVLSLDGGAARPGSVLATVAALADPMLELLARSGATSIAD